MKPALPLLLLPLGLLGACQTYGRPYAPVESVRYQAMGAEPFWILTIGDDRIVLNTGLEATEGWDEEGDIVWPRTLPRTVGGVRTWHSGEGTRIISIEARPGPCATEGGEVFEDDVTVRLSGRELTGCGGRLVTEGGG